MSSFTDPLTVTKVIERQPKKFLGLIPYTAKKDYWITARAFRYYAGEEGSEAFVDVPEGFKTDFASVPRIFWTILPPDGDYSQAAVLHDFLYREKPVVMGQRINQREADGMFYEAMAVLGVDDWKREVMHKALRAFGFMAWNGWKLPL